MTILSCPCQNFNHTGQSHQTRHSMITTNQPTKRGRMSIGTVAQQTLVSGVNIVDLKHSDSKQLHISEEKLSGSQPKAANILEEDEMSPPHHLKHHNGRRAASLQISGCKSNQPRHRKRNHLSQRCTCFFSNQIIDQGQ